MLSRSRSACPLWREYSPIRPAWQEPRPAATSQPGSGYHRGCLIWLGRQWLMSRRTVSGVDDLQGQVPAGRIGHEPGGLAGPVLAGGGDEGGDAGVDVIGLFDAGAVPGCGDDLGLSPGHEPGASPGPGGADESAVLAGHRLKVWTIALWGAAAARCRACAWGP